MWQIHFLRILIFIRYFRHYSTILLVLFLLCTGYIIALFTFPHKHLHVTMDCLFPPTPLSHASPVVKFYGTKPEDGSLAIVKDVFDKVGYQVENQTGVIHWDVLWSHTYPFHELTKELTHLKPHQKVNHFPGSGFITQKSNLARLSLSHVPKSFVLPEEKQKYFNFAKENNNFKWVLKNNNHRSIQLINENTQLNVNFSFIQEYVSKPLLINNRKFDIGVYVILTSIDPLRVYSYSGDILLRFCQEKYNPGSVNSFASYVVGDDYLPVWNVPDLKYYYSILNYTAKESLNAYIQSKGKDPKKLWSQINEVIQEVYFKTEENMKKSAMMFGHLRNFFELVRFDFIVDEEMKIYLLEVNMSPNLSAAHFPQNRLLYEQVLFNTFSVVGLTKKFPKIYIYRGELEVSQKDVQVYPEQCASPVCHKSCKSLKCKPCNQCMDSELKRIITTAYLEHMHRGKYRRLIPLPVAISRNHLSPVSKPVDLSTMNSFMDSWFRGKCLQDLTWCQ